MEAEVRVIDECPACGQFRRADKNWPVRVPTPPPWPREWGYWVSSLPSGGRYVEALTVFGNDPAGIEALRATCPCCGYQVLEPVKGAS